jgi:hypothetical protein
MGGFSAVMMGIAILLAIIFAGVQDHPLGYEGGPITVTAFPVESVTFVQGKDFRYGSLCYAEQESGMSAMLNILFTPLGQIAVPSVSGH